MASGQWISRIAAQVALDGLGAVATGEPRTVGSTEDFDGYYVEDLRFDPSIDDADDQETRANATTADGEVYVQFHFDRTVEVDENKTFRIVNVVVPDFATKLVRDGNGVVIVDDGVPRYDLTGVAEELFGYSIRLACE